MALKDPKEIWKTTLAQIEIKLDSPAKYKTYFSGTDLKEIDEKKAVISVANAYMCDWLKQRHHGLIKDTISHVCGKPVSVEYVIEPDFQKGSMPKVTREEREAPLLEVKKGVHSSVMDALNRAGFNEKYTMKDFVVGNSNRIAHAAASAVAEKPGQVYNPLFIYGRTGVGKTHLAQAVGRILLERNPRKKIIYISSERFLNDLVRSIRTRKTEEFRNRYRSVNMLIIDDIQLISKWVQAQTEFFNTFNDLHANDSHIILICDRPPEEIKDLEDRLRSRFQGGIVVNIDGPEYELRVAILEKKMRSSGFELNPAVIETIAKGVPGNVRELEGALQAVGLFNQMKTDGDLTLEEVNKIIGADQKSKQEKIKTPAILKEVARSFGVSVRDLRGPRRTKDIARARQVAMYILREELGHKLEEVANSLNRSDHTTVIHAIDKVQSLLLTSDGFKEQVVGVIQKLNEGAIQD